MKLFLLTTAALASHAALASSLNVLNNVLQNYLMERINDEVGQLTNRSAGERANKLVSLRTKLQSLKEDLDAMDERVDNAQLSPRFVRFAKFHFE